MKKRERGKIKKKKGEKEEENRERERKKEGKKSISKKDCNYMGQQGGGSQVSHSVPFMIFLENIRINNRRKL
jgi:hypothetical protein